MTAVAPTLPVSPAAAIAHGTPAAPNATGMTNLPPGLANLTSGTILNGSVVGRDAQGHVVVQTANGGLTLATALSLPQGSQLSLQVQSVGAQIQVVVLSINQQQPPPGQPATAMLILPGLPQGQASHPNATGLGGALVPPAGPGLGGTAASSAAGTIETVTVSPGVLTATVVEEAPGAFGTGLQSYIQRAAASEMGSPILSALFNRTPQEADAELPLKGTRLQIRILAFDPVQAADTKTTARNVPGSPQAGGLADGPADDIESGLPGNSAPAARALPQAIAQTLSQTLAQAMTAHGLTPDGRVLAQARDGARLMLATVGEPNISGQVQLRTPLGVLSLSTKIPLPAASRLILEVLGQAQAPLETAPSTASPSTGRGWPALEEALTVLSKADGLAAETQQGTSRAPALPPALENIIPHNGPQLAQALIAAVAAIKTGDIRALLGDHAIRALDVAGRNDLVTRLASDFRQLSSVIPDAAGGDWRSLVIPVHDGNAMQYVQFYLRRNRKQANDNHDPDGMTQFLVNVDLTRIGAMQLDGLVKPKKFDLIVRTRAPLDNGMRRDIAKIFDNSLAATGQSGGVSFQASRPFAQLPQDGNSGVGFNV